MNAIPVRMVRVSVAGGHKTSAMIDMAYYADLGQGAARQVAELNEQYSGTVESARSLFYDGRGNPKKTVSSSAYFGVGKLFLDFTASVQDRFEVTNYTAALSRDFGLSQGYITDLLAIAKSFDAGEISDSVPFTHYRMLKRKQRPLERIGLFQKEKRRLNAMGESGSLPARDSYKRELAGMVKNGRPRNRQAQKIIDDFDP